MAGLKLITYQILFALILFIKPGSEICFYNGSINIIDTNHHAHHQAKDDHDHDCQHEKNEHPESSDHFCCIDFKSIDTQSVEIVNSSLKHFESVSLPVQLHDFIVEFKSQFCMSQKEKEALPISRRDYLGNSFCLHCQSGSAYQFTTTVSLII